MGRQPEPRRGAGSPLRAVDRRPARARRRGRGRDPGGGGAGRDRPGRCPRVRRRGRVQRRLCRGRRRRGAAGAAGRGVPPPWAAGVRPQLQRDRRHALAHRAVGRRARCLRARGGGADLPERQRRRQRARHPPRAAVSHRGRERQPGGALGRRLSRAAGRRGGVARDRAVPRGRRRPAAVPGAGRVRRRRRRGRGAEGRKLPGRGARGRRAQRRAGGRPADLPQPDRGGRRRLGAGRARAARARQDAGRAAARSGAAAGWRS